MRLHSKSSGENVIHIIFKFIFDLQLEEVE